MYWLVNRADYYRRSRVHLVSVFVWPPGDLDLWFMSCWTFGPCVCEPVVSMYVTVQGSHFSPTQRMERLRIQCCGLQLRRLRAKNCAMGFLWMILASARSLIVSGFGCLLFFVLAYLFGLGDWELPTCLTCREETTAHLQIQMRRLCWRHGRTVRTRSLWPTTGGMPRLLVLPSLRQLPSCSYSSRKSFLTLRTFWQGTSWPSLRSLGW